MSLRVFHGVLVKYMKMLLNGCTRESPSSNTVLLTVVLLEFWLQCDIYVFG